MFVMILNRNYFFLNYLSGFSHFSILFISLPNFVIIMILEKKKKVVVSHPDSLVFFPSYPVSF